MGILNVTQDSFYDGGKYNSEKTIIEHIEKMLSEDADFIDIGAYSSRPGAKEISSKEELSRLIPALEITAKRFPEAVISLDTFRSEIANICVQNYNVSIINDISSGEADFKMLETIADLQVPYIMMHKKGIPENMQDNPTYENIIREIILYFAHKTEIAKNLGIHDIIIDPGFGFGKTNVHNYELLDKLDKFEVFDYPLLVGISRKSMIYKTLNINPDDALPGTISLNTIALLKGANILRVHDVKEAKQIISLQKQFL